jgi:hypothetical protein
VILLEEQIGIGPAHDEVMTALPYVRPLLTLWQEARLRPTILG